ncbi:Rne/Rng family ribonuclease [Candidatus Magnetaquicoccus inordinatus]|uniref:Rne/Rng family ribonuclease n=1 Tax=Candidatus Magnetaquicoccus inordinatus TaxID=2496818 RepID=UPI00102C42FE|nr:ribonuclease E/G [Candidatus Magnetaquicoccus inordinatus]
MTKRMLVDATHAEEVRVAVVQDQRLIDLDIETASREQIKGNIYLARVTRVEPSLQAAFVEFYGGRQGFLSINDIHSKYYPPEEPERDSKAQGSETASASAETASCENGDSPGKAPAPDEEEISDELPPTDELRPRHRRRHVPIQRLLSRGQTLLVQVVKEARSNKGASLTTHISLAGRYTVLLPENSGGGGISRKITDTSERKHLKEVLSSMEIPNHVSLIIRTAGLGRTKREIARDMSYLLRLWKAIEEKAAQLKPPALIHEEGDLIIRAIRDLYTTDMEEILIDGQEGYRIGKDFMRLLMPRYVKVVQPYKDSLPLFARYQIENQIESMHERKVPLRAGGYLVIDPTEALVSIDINSGRSTREKDVESTAFKTNIQAAEEVARQLRMRDLGGLIVIDFIDMDDKKHVMEVEKHLKEALKLDRAKIQIGKISPFGLLELSRQRMKPTFNESNRLECPRCKGLGTIRSVESASIHLFRQLEEEVAKGRYSRLTYTTSQEMANYLLNNKREQIRAMEVTHDTIILLYGDPSLQTPEFHKNRVERSPEEIEARQAMQARHLQVTAEPDEADEYVDELDDPDDDPDEEEIGPSKTRESIAPTSQANESTAEKSPRTEAENSEKSRRRRRRRKKPTQTVSAALTEPLDMLGSLDIEQLPADNQSARPPATRHRRNNPPGQNNRNTENQSAAIASEAAVDPSEKNAADEAVRVTQVPGLYVLGGSAPAEAADLQDTSENGTDKSSAGSETESSATTPSRSRRRRRRRRSSQSRSQGSSAQALPLEESATSALEEYEENLEEGSEGNSEESAAILKECEDIFGEGASIALAKGHALANQVDESTASDNTPLSYPAQQEDPASAETTPLLSSAAKEPLADSEQTVESPMLPLADGKQTVEFPALPLADSEQTVESPALPLADSEKAVESPILPLADSEQTVESPILPLADSEQAVESPALPLTDSEKAVESPALPLTDSEKAVESPALPLADSEKAVESPAVEKGTSELPKEDSVQDHSAPLYSATLPLPQESSDAEATPPLLTLAQATVDSSIHPQPLPPASPPTETQEVVFAEAASITVLTVSEQLATSFVVPIDEKTETASVASSVVMPSPVASGHEQGEPNEQSVPTEPEMATEAATAASSATEQSAATELSEPVATEPPPAPKSRTRSSRTRSASGTTGKSSTTSKSTATNTSDTEGAVVAAPSEKKPRAPRKRSTKASTENQASPDSSAATESSETISQEP